MPEQYDSGIDVVNAPSKPLSDLYHVLLRAPWWVALLAIAAMVLAVNLVFALVFLATGGVAGARPGSFADAFFFSVQTVGTIGYGAMYPQSLAAHLAVTFESIAALIVAAISTGLVFSKFSIPQARLEFARWAVISVNEGVPTLAVRLANTRGNYIAEAQVRLTVVRLETTREGRSFYRMYDLRLLRDRSPALGRTWQVMHPIEPDSPLHGATKETMRAQDTEIIIAVTGIDGTSSQTIHSNHNYVLEDIRFGYRYADMLRPKPDGRLELDYGKLHEVTPAS